MKVLIVTAMWPTPENPARGAFVRSQAESLKKLGVDVESFHIHGRHPKLAYAESIFRLRRVISRNRIDVIHAHYSYAGVVARTQWKVPVVVTYHGDDLLGTVGPDGRITAKSKIAVALGKALARFADANVVVSPEMHRRLRGIEANIIPGELDLQLFRPLDQNKARQELGLDLRKKYVLFAADPGIAVKRFPLAADAVRELAKEDSSVELLVIYREPQSRFCLYLNACDVLVFPSFQEGSPTVIKQAMACNLPIVATDVGDVRTLISGAERCRICAPTVPAFVAALGEALSHPQRSNGRDFVGHLDGGVIARQLIRVYENVLRNSGRQLAPFTESA